MDAQKRARFRLGVCGVAASLVAAAGGMDARRMTLIRGRVPLFLAAVVLALAAAPPVAGAKTISGKLSKAGYTVLALAPDGEAASDEAKGGKFELRPPASKVTLQLRDKHGKYAGPVVVGEKDKRTAIVGVKSGAKLGKVTVLEGYAKPKRKLDPEFLDRKRTAKAKDGVPIGAGNFGFVRTGGGSLRVPRAQAAGVATGGDDQDTDGVPNTLDVDANGNGILDNQEDQGAAGRGFEVFSQLGAFLEDSLNANASGVSDAQINNLLQQQLFLVIKVVSGDRVELDCGGLSWCSAGGTGQVAIPGQPPGPAFPECCDDDSDGFGTMTPREGIAGPEFQLRPRAAASEIGSGDLLVQRSTSGGTETQLPASLNFVFNTTPALISWQSSAGESGTVSYPVARGTPEAPGDPGTDLNPFSVTPGSDGHIVITMTFWRPQRRAIPEAGEGSGFIDTGQLAYVSRVVFNETNTVVDCRNASAYSTTDPNLVPDAGPAGGFLDQAGDAPADPGNTLTYSLDITSCLDANGAAWTSGQTIQVELVGKTIAVGDNSGQQFFFKRT